jgi:voltage-gated potassium channel
MAEYDDRPRSVADRSSVLAYQQVRTFVGRISRLGAAVAILLLLATVALSRSEGVDAWYAFRWALDTASTLGGFPQARTLLGQIVQVGLVLIGLATLFYALATVTEFFSAGHLGEALAVRRREAMLERFTDHYIVCGFGRVGRQVARDLYAAGATYVVVDTNAENRELAEQHGMVFVDGDATDGAVLVHVGIARARSLIACVDSDAYNVFITLTARELRDDIAIVARAASEDTEAKLRRAGADRVISPYKASGTEMARLALHPQLSGVVDVDAEYRMEEIVVGGACEGIGKTVDDIRGGAMIVGLRRGAQFQPQPPSETTLAAGDVIVAMGTAAALQRLENLLEPQ